MINRLTSNITSLPNLFIHDFTQEVSECFLFGFQPSLLCGFLIDHCYGLQNILPALLTSLVVVIVTTSIYSPRNHSCLISTLTKFEPA